MFEDFDQDFNEMEDDFETIKKNVDMQQHLEKIKDQLVRANYEALVQNGIDFKMMKNAGMDIQPIREILQQMIDWFQELEEYEKCAVIHKELQNA